MTQPSRTSYASPEPDLDLAAEMDVYGIDRAGDPVQVARQVRRGVWKRYGRVVVAHNGPLTPDQTLWVALLRAPTGSVLAGASVLARSPLAWAAPAKLQIVSPACGPTADLPGVRGRRSNLLTLADVHPTRQPPQQRMARAVVDHMAELTRPSDIRALLAAPVQKRLLRVEELFAALERTGRRRHQELALCTLQDIGQGAHSVHEIDFGLLLRQAGLPTPDRQAWRSGPHGRRYLDAVWERFRLHVEIDGLGHLQVTAWLDDCDRANELELGKHQERRLRIPGSWITDRPEHVVDQVFRGLVAGGWRPNL